ncbi:hypothetical protein ACIBI9_04190 [Nonomuraea sp. NPDC050451]|uniref:hypothetical protein n=1 Tax=Nonomuraea sp. NPDC050451 TaxID=3364364 RepID=UPI00378AE89D
MATPNVVEVLQDSQSGANASVSTAAGTQVGDLLVAAFGNNYFDGANMAAPTGTAGTWTPKAYGDAGVNTAHLRIYTRSVTSGGAQTVTISPVSSEEVYLFVYVIRDWITVDDATASASATQTTSPVAPSATAIGADDLLLCFWQTGAPHGGPTFTAAPGGMTNLLQVADPVGPFSRLGTARQVLAASGATGSRTATISAASQYASASIVIAGASGGGAVSATGLAPAAAVGLAVARKVAPESGRACLAPAVAGMVRKVAVVTARASVATVSSATARKSAAAVGGALSAATSSATTRKTASSVGRACLAAATSSTTRKLTLVASLTPAAATTTTGARKVTLTSGRGTAAVAAVGGTRKVAPRGGTAYAAAWSYRSQVLTRLVTGACSAAFVGSVTARKVVPASSRSWAAASSSSAARRVAAVLALSEMGAAGGAHARKTVASSGRGVLAATGLAGARKLAPTGGRSYAAVSAAHTSEPEQSAGVMFIRERPASMALKRDRAGSSMAMHSRRTAEMEGA